MEPETLSLPELARYLQRDVRDLEKLVARGTLPGRRVGGRWTVHRSEVHHWLEESLPDFSETQLEQVESVMAGGESNEDLVLAPLLTVATTAVPLEGRTVPGVLSSLVQTANGGWQIYDSERILAAVRDREAVGSTAQAGGVALPHPGRRLPDALGEPVLAFGRTPGGIPFGGPRGESTDLFFLILCRDDASHLRVLARLARLFLRDGFLEGLRAAETPHDAIRWIVDGERQTF